MKSLFAAGQVPGIKIVSRVEDFVVEPNDPDLAGCDDGNNT